MIPAASSKPIRARECPLRCDGTTRGITRSAGMLAKTGIEAINPAVAGENPPLSRILGSQLLNPCAIAKPKNPITMSTRMLCTLMSLLNTSRIFALSVVSGGFGSLDNNNHSNATTKTSRP